MNILICPDSFKGSLNSVELCQIISQAFNTNQMNAMITSIPMADGGEGSLQVIYNQGNTELIEMNTVDPYGRPISAFYLWNPKTESVIIEMAQASGIERLGEEERNCMNTSTYGTGVQIVDAIKRFSPKKIYITVGSSSTNEAGLGMLAAMGCNIVSSNGKYIERPQGKDLKEVLSISLTTIIKELIDGVEFIIVHDVNNPLTGLKGAAYTYAKQKGATTKEVILLDEGLKVVRDIIQVDLGIDLDEVDGSGAGGGIAGGGYAYLNASLMSGTDFVSELTSIESEIEKANLVITGEGRLDSQTLHEKLVCHIARLCMKHQKSMIIICGENVMNSSELVQLGNPVVYALNKYNQGGYTNETTKRDLKKIVGEIVKSL